MMTEIKNKIKNKLEGFVCKSNEILEDLPELATTEGVVEHCLDEAIKFLQDGFEAACEEDEIFDFEKEIENVINWLIQTYELTKDEDLELVKQVVSEFEKEKKDENEYRKCYGPLFSNKYIYIGYTDGLPDIDVFDERCVPDWFDVVQEIDTTDYNYIYSQFKNLTVLANN